MPSPDLTSLDNRLPTETRLSLYVATRHLVELDAALRLLGLPTRYERPGAQGIEQPRLYVRQPRLESHDEAILATPLPSDDAKLEWWFEWARDHRRICPTADLPKATQLITERLSSAPDLE